MITAIILAAGQSKRMGQPKMLLPWGNTTVLGQIIETLQRAEVENILVVTGSAREEVEEIVKQHAVSSRQNADYAREEMLSSLQAGLRAARDNPSVTAALICLGDQPQVEERNVRAVVDAFKARKSHLVVPSYQMRRGHPWLVSRAHWNEILQMKSPQTPRAFLNRHAAEIEYVNVANPSILCDLDTFKDYLKSRP